MTSLDKQHVSELNVTEIEKGYRLTMVAGPAGKYRLSELDDYNALPRRNFRWSPPVTMDLCARVSHPESAGTWGFGLWNDPFSFGKGPGNQSPRLPVLPNAAWFFYASPPNYLSLQDDHPAQGFLAATFCAPLIPPPFLLLGLPAAPFLLLRPVARLLRRLGRLVIQDSGALVPVADLTAWHDYRMELLPKQVRFLVDGNLVAETPVVPRGKLGFVLWIDNQYAVFDAAGRAKWGSLETRDPVHLEVKGLKIDQ